MLTNRKQAAHASWASRALSQPARMQSMPHPLCCIRPGFLTPLSEPHATWLDAQACRAASELWRPFLDCNYGAAALLRRRAAPPLALYVPAAMTGVEGAEDSAIRFVGTKVVALRTATPACDRPSACGVAAAAAAAAARATAFAYQRRASALPPLRDQRAAMPAPAAVLQNPAAAAIAAAKQLAAAAAAAAPAAGSLLRQGGSTTMQSLKPRGGGMHRVPRCLDVPLLSPAGSSGSLSMASSSDSFGGVLRQLASQSSPRSPECWPLPQPPIKLLPGSCSPRPDTHAPPVPLPPSSRQQYDQPPRQQPCVAGRPCVSCRPPSCSCAAARLHAQLKRLDCGCQQQAPSQWAGLCGHASQHHVAVP